VEYRLAGKSDVPLLAELNQQLIRDEGHGNPMSVAELQDRMRAWLARTYTAVLFLDEDTMVAYALYRTDNTGIFLRQFFVCRDERGKGFGRAALALLCERIWPAGATVTLEALSANRAAIDFWRAVGFEEYAVTLRRRIQGGSG
jgi:predicted GNAT family acetyltransferase